MNTPSGRNRHRRGMITVGIFVTVIAAAIGYRNLTTPNATNDYYPPDVRQPKQLSADELEMKWEREALDPRRDLRGRIDFSPTSVTATEITPELLEGIPPEQTYAAIPLSEIAATYTETQFQQDREEWYRELFLTEYERAGHRDAKWDTLVTSFLTESARRISVTRFARHRSPKFYHDSFDSEHSERGEAILDIGCKDALVQSLLVEELVRQQRFEDVNVVAAQLKTSENASSYGDFIQFQIAGMLVRSGRGAEFRERMTRHFRKALVPSEHNPVERRILYEEGLTLLAPGFYSVLGQFIVLLENQPDTDEWLRHMILGDFHSRLALDADALIEFWPPYIDLFDRQPQQALHGHMAHYRKAYELYLSAWRMAPQLPEAPHRLFKMTKEQMPAVFVPGVLDRLSPASPRFWFDQAVAAQCDFRPMYREYRFALLPPPQAQKADWTRYGRLVEFGLECVNSERFDTQIPYGFHEAIQAMARHDEYGIPPVSPRNRDAYSHRGLIEAFTKLLDGYSDRLTDDDRAYYDTLMTGMNWIQGHRDIAKERFQTLTSRPDQQALDELYLDVVEMQREFTGTKTRSAVRLEQDEIRQMSLLPDRRQLLLALNDGRFRIVDLESHDTHSEHTLLAPEPDAHVISIISHNAHFVASYSHPVMKVCDTESFSEVAGLSFPEELKSFEVSRTGRYVAVSVEKRVEIWETSPQRKIAEIDIRVEDGIWRGGDWRPHLQQVRSYAFSNDETTLAFIRGGIIETFPPAVGWSYKEAPFLVNRLYVWSIPQNKLIHQDEPFIPNINSLRFTEDDGHLLVAGTQWSRYQRSAEYYPEIAEHHSIKRIDPETSETVLEYAGRENSLWMPSEFGEDRSLVVAMAERKLIAWDAESGVEVASAQWNSQNVHHTAYSQQLNRIVSMDSEGMVSEFADLLKTDVDSVFLEPDVYENYAPRRILFHPQEKRIAVCDQKAGGMIWDFSNAERTLGRAYRAAGSVGTTVLDFSPDLRQMAATDDAMPGVAVVPELQTPVPLAIWDTESGRVTRVLEGQKSVIECAKFDPTGRYILAGLRDGRILVWDLQSESNQPSQIMNDHLAAVTQLQFSPDGQFLLSGGQGGEAFGKKFPPAVRLWESGESTAHQFRTIKTLELAHEVAHPYGVQNIAMSDDGTRVLATYGWDTFLLTIDGTLSCQLAGSQAAFLPDGSGFLTAGGANLADRMVIWDFNGTKIRELRGGHRRPITALAFSVEGSVLLSASPSEAVACWNAASGDRVLYVSDLFR